MGDRGNIIVIDDSTEQGLQGVVLYTHWSGSEIGDILKGVLARKERWDDSSYLARMIFGAMTGGDQGSTGFGISSFIGDNEHPYLVVDVARKVVVKIPHNRSDGDTAQTIMKRARDAKGTPFAKFAGVEA